MLTAWAAVAQVAAKAAAAAEAAKQWYVSNAGGGETGPHTIEEMKAYIQKGIVKYDRTIRHKDHTELVQAYQYGAQFPELVSREAPSHPLALAD